MMSLLEGEKKYWASELYIMITSSTEEVQTFAIHNKPTSNGFTLARMLDNGPHSGNECVGVVF